MPDFSMLVGATRLPVSLAGKPAVLSCLRGLLQVTDTRNGTVLLAGPAATLRFAHARTKMVSIVGPGTSLNIFGYDRYTPRAAQLIAERGLPPLVGAAQAATWFPDAFAPGEQFLSGTRNVTELLPRLLAGNGIHVAPR